MKKKSKLETYIKKTKKADPFHGDSGPKGFKGPTGVKKPDQYASKTGKGITDDATSSNETDPVGKLGAYESIKSNGKKKQRPYLDEA